MKNQISIYNVQVYIEMSVNSLMIQNMYSMCEKTKTFHSSDYINYVPNRGIRVASELTVWSDIYDLYILREDANYDNDLRDWIYQDDDFNNHILIEKRKSEVNLSPRWADFDQPPIQYYLSSEEDTTEELPPPPQEEYTPF